LVQEYDINAFATEVNLIALYSGLMDQLAGDSSAIACVIGHEMAHHVSRHIAASEAERVRLTAEIQDQARQEIEAEIEDAQGDARDSRIGAGVLDAFGIGIGSGILRNNARKREAEANQRIQEIIDLKQAELEARLLEQNRTNEFEADQLGYTYVARAGFEPEGCFRTMEVLARTQGAEFDTTHPAVPKRIEALETLLKENPPEELELQGNSRISASQPLTYDLSEDKVSLRINSVRGGSAADDLERLFGQ
jgi:predicted Zn-dependent protease